MGKYDNVNAKELHEKKMEMFNDLGGEDGSCNGVSCINCPLSAKNNGTCECFGFEAKYFDEYVKIIMEYEPNVDWENVEVDTKIMVRSSDHYGWSKMYFAKFENGSVYAWDNGTTEFSANGESMCWEYVKLYKQ